MGRKSKLPDGMRRRKTGRIEYRFSVDGQRYSVTGMTVQECKENELDERERIKQRMATRNRNVTVDAYYKAWKDSRKGVVKPSTLYADDIRYNHIGKTLGKMKVVEIERQDVISLQKHLQGSLTTQGVNLSIALLKSILRAAVNDRIISWNPADGVKSLKRKETPAAETIHRALTQQEQDIFFSYASGSWYRYFFKFLLLTGMRTGEASALTWKDIDHKGRVIHITKTVTRIADNEYTVNSPKTKTSKRDIPLTADMQAVLQEQKEMQQAMNGSKVTSIDQRIFTTMDGSGYIKTTTISSVIKNVCCKATADGQTLERFSAHGFRDTFATRAIENGMNPQTLKTILGHSSLTMTMDLYCHVMPETKRQEMEKVKIII